MAEAERFDPVPHARVPGHPLLGFFADAPSLPLEPPELTQISTGTAAGASHAIHYELSLRSARSADEAFVIFPAGENIQEISVATPSGPRRAKLHKLRNGATVLLIAGLPAAGVQFGIDAGTGGPVVQVYDQSYGLPEGLAGAQALKRARPPNATSSQDGDVTVVQRTVSLDPAAGR
jgi:hypothetical protein